MNDEGARQRHPLLFAAGQMPRVMAQPVAEADAASIWRAASRASARPASSSGNITFSSALNCGINWKFWNTNPTLSLRSKARASSLRPASAWPNKATSPPDG